MGGWWAGSSQELREGKQCNIWDFLPLGIDLEIICLPVFKSRKALERGKPKKKVGKIDIPKTKKWDQIEKQHSSDSKTWTFG